MATPGLIDKTLLRLKETLNGLCGDQKQTGHYIAKVYVSQGSVRHVEQFWVVKEKEKSLQKEIKYSIG